MFEFNLWLLMVISREGVNRMAHKITKINTQNCFTNVAGWKLLQTAFG